MVLISRDPPVFLSWVSGEPAENRFSNHNEVYNLLVDCYLAFKELLLRRTTRTTCTCTCSAAASRGTRCSRASSSFQPRLQSLSCSPRTSLGTLRLLVRLLMRGLWRCWRACSVSPNWTPRRGTSWTSPTLASAFLCTSFPRSTTIPPPSSYWSVATLQPCSPRAVAVTPPPDYTLPHNTNPAVVALLRELISARHATTLLLCIKHGYVYVRRSKRQRTATTVALNTQLAFEKLNDNVWSYIMGYL